MLIRGSWSSPLSFCGGGWWVGFAQSFLCPTHNCVVLSLGLGLWQYHVSIHTEKDGLLKFCYYFNNDKTFPYANIGCMFLHKIAPNCHFQEKCSKKLCQFKHSQSVKINQFKCEKCETIVISDEALKTHIDEFHAENTTHNIEDEEMFDNYVKTNFPTFFDYYLKNDRYFPC